MWKKLIMMCFVCSATLTAETKVLAFAGSTRGDSFNKKLILEAASMARQQGVDVTVIDLKDYPIPHYDEDLEKKEGMPASAKELRKMMIQSDVIFIASPEYNASLSSVLKNAIDWASRGETGGGSREAFKGKRFAIMATSPGSTGGARGLVHLRTILEDVGGSVISFQVAVPGAYNAFDEKGHLKSEKIKAELQKLVQMAIN